MIGVTKERALKLSELENKIGYVFEKKYMLNRALTHSSYANQYGLKYIEHNERLEFLGDSVLGLVISEFIFSKYRTKPEGKLTKIRANLVCEPSLYERAKVLGLGEYLLLGKGEEMTGGRERASILADAFEALIAAIYIDGGIVNAREFILSSFSGHIDDFQDGEKSRDYKSTLQEYVQSSGKSAIRYEIVDEEGPAHDRTFHVIVSIDDRETGKGSGKSKKIAEQRAARDALTYLGVIKL